MRFRAAEFFAGIGLVRLALEREGVEVVFANDIDGAKRSLYAANFDASCFVLKDVRQIGGHEVPTVDLATASFPCIDLSLAGNRAGLRGKHSNTFWEFARILKEMGERRPRAILLENVSGFVSARGGADLSNALRSLNVLGYGCGLAMVDAKWFVPQSRPRLFIVGSTKPLAEEESNELSGWLRDLLTRERDLSVCELSLPSPPARKTSLADIVERLSPDDPVWWDRGRFRRFRESLRPIHARRLDKLRRFAAPTWATAYRRTRDGVPVWEIRSDDLGGCLRTARGGSSKQAIVEAGEGEARGRWMTPREYARLQGAPEYRLDGARRNVCLSAFGDAVCVPAVRWIARHSLLPLLEGHGAATQSRQLSLAV